MQERKAKKKKKQLSNALIINNYKLTLSQSPSKSFRYVMYPDNPPLPAEPWSISPAKLSQPQNGARTAELPPLFFFFFLYLKFLQLNLWTAFLKTVSYHYGGQLQAPFFHSRLYTALITVARRLIYFYVIPPAFQASSVGRCSFQETLP